MSETEPEAKHHFPVLTSRISIGLLLLAYLPLALTFSLLTRAYEADDEPAHTQYIEYVVAHGSLPHIAVSNGLESHQPPLYYLLAAGWQHLLQIPAFTPKVVIEHYKDPWVGNRLPYSHNYTSTEHQDATYLHEIRLLSVLLGLVTVFCGYAAAKVAGLSESIALGSGLFVALLPRELVVTSVVTNDALVIPLCALALLLFLLAERSRSDGRVNSRRLHILAMGVTLGAAAATKFNSLPVAGVLFALTALPCVRRTSSDADTSAGTTPSPEPLPRSLDLRQSRSGTGSTAVEPQTDAPASTHIAFEWREVIDLVIGAAGSLLVSGWVFLRNEHLYGQFLATKASESYLRALLLHSVPWSAHIVFSEFPRSLFYTAWFAQPNFFLPIWINQVLGYLTVLTLLVGGWALLRRRNWAGLRLDGLSAAALLGCIAAAAMAVLITIKTTSIGDARTALVGIAAFSAVLVLGSSFLAGKVGERLAPIGVLLWPVALLTVDIYVLIHILIPVGGL